MKRLPYHQAPLAFILLFFPSHHGSVGVAGMGRGDGAAREIYLYAVTLKRKFDRCRASQTFDLGAHRL